MLGPLPAAALIWALGFFCVSCFLFFKHCQSGLGSWVGLGRSFFSPCLVFHRTELPAGGRHVWVQQVGVLGTSRSRFPRNSGPSFMGGERGQPGSWPQMASGFLISSPYACGLWTHRHSFTVLTKENIFSFFFFRRTGRGDGRGECLEMGLLGEVCVTALKYFRHVEGPDFSKTPDQQSWFLPRGPVGKLRPQQDMEAQWLGQKPDPLTKGRPPLRPCRF